MNHRRNTLLLILTATVVRMLIAATLELGNDEVYYRLYANPLQWNYFDHPPMVGWLIRLSTFNLRIDTGFTVRLGAILCSALTTWFLFKAAARLLNDYAGFLAALLYTGTIYGSIIAGTFILPDSPQMVCWSAALLLLIKVTESKTITTRTSKDILWFGVVTGLGMLCKVHSVFLWVGFGLYIVIYNRSWLQHWAVYAAAGITLLCFVPVIIWNIQHHFVTFFFHGKRVNVAAGGLHLDGFLTFTGGQILYTNPVVFFIVAKAIWHRDLFVKPAQKRMLLLAGLPLILVTTMVSFFKDLLPHWTGPAYASLILLSACYYARLKWVSPGRTIPLSFSVANSLILLVVTAGLVLIHFYPGTIGQQQNDRKGETDFTLDLYGWKDFGRSFRTIYHRNHAIDLPASKTILLCNRWFPAAHIDYYVGQPLQLSTITIGPIEDVHQYQWLNQQRGMPADSTDLYVISPSNYVTDWKDFAALHGKAPQQIDTVVQYRGNKEARRFFVFYFKRDIYHLVMPDQY